MQTPVSCMERRKLPPLSSPSPRITSGGFFYGAHRCLS
jgi:hypothetical protein